MIEPRIVFANGSDYDWDPILISVVDRSPEVYQNLSSQTVLEGTAVTFTANAYAGTNLKYQWYYANSSTAEGEAISGAVEDSYVVEASAKTAGYYYCCVSNSCAAVFTNRASVTPIYVISYHANGGSKEPAGQLKTHGYTLVLDHAKPVREGYIFRGWSEDSASNVPTYLNGGRGRSRGEYGGRSRGCTHYRFCWFFLYFFFPYRKKHNTSFFAITASI